jgi:hypothetical protein
MHLHPALTPVQRTAPSQSIRDSESQARSEDWPAEPGVVISRDLDLLSFILFFSFQEFQIARDFILPDPESRQSIRQQNGTSVRPGYCAPRNISIHPDPEARKSSENRRSPSQPATHPIESPEISILIFQRPVNKNITRKKHEVRSRKSSPSPASE